MLFSSRLAPTRPAAILCTLPHRVSRPGAGGIERTCIGAPKKASAGWGAAHRRRDIGRVDALMSDIGRASREQAHGIAQVGSAVTQMDQTTQQNAALVEQSAAAAESLNQQAQALVPLVSRFRQA